ncbi:MAG: CotS family spore coat protein [Lachnospiraceae bacterium]
MNDRTLDVLEQYELDIRKTWKGRGVYYCDTSQGLHVLKEFHGSEEKLERISQLLTKLECVEFFSTDRPVRNKEGTFLVKDFEEKKFVLKRWQEGRECDPRSDFDICRAVEALAVFHEKAHHIWDFESEKEAEKFVAGDLQTEMEKRTRELKRVQQFIRGKQKKSPFESCYLEIVPEYLEQAGKLAEQLKETPYASLRKKAVEERRICHGEYMQHNVLFDRSKVMLTNFEHVQIDLQLMDLFLFLRKIMEKQGWRISTGEKLLRTYEVICPLSAEEKRILALRLAYPEKLWKLANHYYHTKKAWIPAKSLDKLKIFAGQQKDKENFVRKLLET